MLQLQSQCCSDSDDFSRHLTEQLLDFIGNLILCGNDVAQSSKRLFLVCVCLTLTTCLNACMLDSLPFYSI